MMVNPVKSFYNSCYRLFYTIVSSRTAIIKSCRRSGMYAWVVYIFMYRETSHFRTIKSSWGKKDSHWCLWLAGYIQSRHCFFRWESAGWQILGPVVFFTLWISLLILSKQVSDHLFHIPNGIRLFPRLIKLKFFPVYLLGCVYQVRWFGRLIGL